MSEMARGKQPWAMHEIATMRNNAHLGIVVVAQMLGRSIKQVENAARRQRISLRREGERRGRIMGQRGALTGVLVDLRDGVISREIDMGEMEAMVRALAMPGPICPTCGQRPQERPTTGLCEVCHLKYLARAHRDAAERKAARREEQAARQAKHRA